MTTFPTFSPPGDINCSPGSSVTHKPRVISAEFGDGYVQRLGDGINTDLATFDLSIDSLTRSEARTIRNFFAARAGVEAFWFTPPDDTDPHKYVCTQWTHSEGSSESGISISAQLVEVVDP